MIIASAKEKGYKAVFQRCHAPPSGTIPVGQLKNNIKESKSNINCPNSFKISEKSLSVGRTVYNLTIFVAQRVEKEISRNRKKERDCNTSNHI